MEKVYTPEQVAEQLQISRYTVMEHLRGGRLKGMKIGKLWRVRESDLEEFMQRQTR